MSGRYGAEPRPHIIFNLLTLTFYTKDGVIMFKKLSRVTILFLAFALCAQAQDDRARIRSILDKAGMKDRQIEDVAEFNSAGRVIVLKLSKRGLSGTQLKTFPMEIIQLTTLKGLFLKDNDITTLPSEIGDLTQLIELDVGNNPFGTLPGTIGNLSNLRILDVRFCGLSGLPPEFGNLRSLETLHMWGNEFVMLPDCITELGNLKEIYLKDNKLISLPNDIVKMDKLRYVDVQLNNLCQLPSPVEVWLLSRNKRYKEFQKCF
jgi:hypothetical protein